MPIDLTGKFFEVIQSQIKPGQGLNLDFSVANTGEEDAVPFSFDFYISKDQDISSQGDFKLGTYSIQDGLEAESDTGVKHYRYNTPAANDSFWTDEDGTYYVGMVIDPKNRVTETDETNNRNLGAALDSDSFLTPIFLPLDLKLTSFEIRQQAINPGQALDVSFTIANESENDANPFSTNLYISKDANITKDDLQLGVVGIYDIRNGIAAGSDTGKKTYRYATPDAANEFWKDGNGKYYVGMIIDPKGEVTETDTTNNSNQGAGIDSDSFVTDTFLSSDLKGTSFKIGQEKIKRGQALDVSFAIANESENDANPFSANLYISQDANISADDRQIGIYDLKNGLAAGSDTGEKTYRYTTPGADDQFWADGDGTYYVGMVIDPKNEVTETNETNNSNLGAGLDSDSFMTAAVVPPDLRSDLKGTSFEIAQPEINRGQALDVSFTIANETKNDANPFSANLYISQDANITKEDVRLGTYALKDGLAAGSDTGEKTHRYTTPGADDQFWADGDGTYYVGMVIDPENEVTETNETNNSNLGAGLDSDSFTTSPVVPPDLRSDLKGTSFEIAQPEINRGQALDVSFTIANETKNDANPFSANLYISRDPNISADDRQIGTYALKDGLAAGSDTGEKTHRYTTPGADDQFWADGGDTYYVGMVIDPENEVTETDETNNSNLGTGRDLNDVKITTLAPPADLTGELILTPETLVAGETFDFGFTIANNGGVDSGEFQVDLYVSQDDDISAQSDFKIGAYGINDIEAGSDTDILSSPYSLPGSGDEFWANGDGTYYLGMVIDGEEQVVEINELNNSNQGLGKDYNAVDIDVDTDVLDDLADLKTNGFQVERPEIATGDTFEVTYDIFNEGNHSADHFAAGFYIFTEEYLTNNNQLSINEVPEVYYLQGDHDSALINLDPFSGTGRVTTTLTMPTNWEGFTGSGDYYIGLAADPFGDVQELNEFNNSLVGEFTDYQKVSIDVV
jgi:subtilase family serine protease